MQQKKSINFGLRGWLLIIFQFIGFMAFTVFTNYPMNLLAGSGFYGGISGYDASFQAIGTSLVANVYTYAAIVVIIIQLLIAKNIGKLKSVKALAMILGFIAILGAAFITFYPPTMTVSANVLWLVIYGIVNVVIIMYSTFSIGIIMGQWFPRRKGTVMGIATLAFPIANGLLGPVAEAIFAADAPDAMPYLIQYVNGMGGYNTVQKALIPFLIVTIIGWLIGLIFVKDYPEQVGAYRDNDKSITPEVADAMMKAEIEAKKTTVWGPGHTFKSRDFWFITIPAGLLLMFSVGVMTQTKTIFSMVGLGDKYTAIMIGVMICGLIGSYILGIIDTKIGTKKSMIIAVCLMILSCILGVVGTGMTKTVVVDNQAAFTVEEFQGMMSGDSSGESAGESAGEEGESAGEEGESAGEEAAPAAEVAEAAAEEAAPAAEVAEAVTEEAAPAATNSSATTGQILVIIAFLILALFMGASSNYTVSAAAQYWRREDFGSVFASVNSVANLINAIGPMIIAGLLFSAAGVTGVLVAVGVGGVVSLILMLCFSGKHVKVVDDKYRAAAGKALDDELVGRK